MLRRFLLCTLVLVGLLAVVPASSRPALSSLVPGAAAATVPATSPECGPPAYESAPLRPASTASQQFSTVSRSLVYGSDAGQELRAELTAPADDRGRLPAVLVVHGGAWTHGSPALMEGASDALAAAGFVAFDVAYRLAAPGHPGFPGQLADLQQAVAYLRGNASALHVDPSRLGVLGSSAGGNLALLLATEDEQLCGSQEGLSAVVTWSAPVDLARYGRSSQRHCDYSGSALCPVLYRAEQEYIGCSYQACPARWEAASVSSSVRSGDPPTLLFNSSNELVPLWQPRELAGLLSSRAVPNGLVVFPGHLHGIRYAREALPMTIEFFRQYLG